MNRPRLFRGLRIAWSVGFGILCLLLMALWVRSYWRFDVFDVDMSSNSQRLEIASRDGTISVGSYPCNIPGYVGGLEGGWNIEGGWKLKGGRYSNGPFSQEDIDMWTQPKYEAPRTILASGPYSWFFAIPYCLPVLISAALAAVPWIPWSPRFSLRTLLIVTTIIAVVLGLIVYFAGQSGQTHLRAIPLYP